MIELPKTLEVVDNLSVSSLRLLWQCPEKWRRRYVEREYEAPSGAMIAGSATGAAESQHYAHVVESGPEGALSTDDVLDLFSDEWNDRTDRDDIEWGSSKPEQLRKQAEVALATYHEQIAPSVQPVSVERQFELSFPDVQWGFTGFIDLEESDGAVSDLKLKARKLGQGDADSDPQASSYLLARRAEGEPAPAFRFHTMVRTKEPVAEVVTTTRTDAQLDAFLRRIYIGAAEIHWRLEHDVWGGAPAGAWWCTSRSCGYWSQCPFGGRR